MDCISLGEVGGMRPRHRHFSKSATEKVQLSFINSSLTADGGRTPMSVNNNVIYSGGV